MLASAHLNNFLRGSSNDDIRVHFMKAVIQRVSKASVSIKDAPSEVRQTGRGLVILLGVGKNDTDRDADYLAQKIANLRIFPKNDKLNLSAIDVNADVLVIPQFTLFGDCLKGRRPDFTGAAEPGKANKLYKQFVDLLKSMKLKVEEGKFGSEMLVEIHNDGPVTIVLDTEIIPDRNK